MIVKYPKTYFRIIKICSDSFLSNSKLTVRQVLTITPPSLGRCNTKTDVKFLLRIARCKTCTIAGGQSSRKKGNIKII